MKFGVFDHVDDSDTPPHMHLENRLRMIEVYDRCGIHGYHVAEHHGTPLGLAPSPSVYLAAAAQRTKRIRLGPLVYSLPGYHPLRLIEEVAMLDNMSHGRYMLGVGRGASPVEMAFYEVPTQELQARFEETLQILLKGFQTDRLTYKGKYHQFTDVPMTLQPYQKPYPELWYGARSPESIAWAARNGVNVVTLALDDDVRAMTDLYRQVWAEAGGTSENLPLMGVSRHIVVADTDAEARQVAEEAYAHWKASFAKLWIENGLNVPLENIYPETWADVEAIKNGCAGSPETVRRFALEEARRGGFNYLVSGFAFGNMTVDQVTRSVELFSNHVMPAFERFAAER